MPSAIRVGDMCSGHDGYPPRPCVSGSNNVFINKLPAHRTGDAWASHCKRSCHTSVMAAGSPTVFVNGIPMARNGDPVVCGSVAVGGSGDVFANG